MSSRILHNHVVVNVYVLGDAWHTWTTIKVVALSGLSIDGAQPGRKPRPTPPPYTSDSAWYTGTGSGSLIATAGLVNAGENEIPDEMITWNVAPMGGDGIARRTVPLRGSGNVEISVRCGKSEHKAVVKAVEVTGVKVRSPAVEVAPNPEDDPDTYAVAVRANQTVQVTAELNPAPDMTDFPSGILNWSAGTFTYLTDNGVQDLSKILVPRVLSQTRRLDISASCGDSHKEAVLKVYTGLLTVRRAPYGKDERGFGATAKVRVGDGKADIRVESDPHIPGATFALRVPAGQNGAGSVSPASVTVGADGTGLAGYTAGGTVTLNDGVTVQLQPPDFSCDTDSVMASVTVKQLPGASPNVNSGDYFVSPVYLKGEKSVDAVDVEWRYAPTDKNPNPGWQSIGSANGDCVVADTWWAVVIPLDVAKKDDGTPKTRDLTPADRTVYVQFRSVGADDSRSDAMNMTLIWKMTEPGSADHLIQAGEKMILCGPSQPPPLPAESMSLSGYGTYNAAPAIAPNWIVGFDSEDHDHPLTTTVTCTDDGNELLKISGPTINVIKTRQVEAIAWWEGDSLPGLFDWVYIYARMLVNNIGWTTRVPWKAKWVLYRNPKTDCYSPWATYSIDGGKKANPPLGSWNPLDTVLLWWSPKLNQNDCTRVPFYVKYKGLTLERDIGDASCEVVPNPRLPQGQFYVWLDSSDNGQGCRGEVKIIYRPTDLVRNACGTFVYLQIVKETMNGKVDDWHADRGEHRGIFPASTEGFKDSDGRRIIRYKVESITDRPGLNDDELNGINTFSQDFMTFIVCADGNWKGKVLGCIHWGVDYQIAAAPYMATIYVKSTSKRAIWLWGKPTIVNIEGAFPGPAQDFQMVNGLLGSDFYKQYNVHLFW